MNKYAKEILNSKLCNACPRKCDVDRINSFGFCKMPNKALVSKVMVHNWEEPLLTNIYDVPTKSTKKGSGAIFFSGCNLQCIYCQNSQISSNACGKFVTPQELANIFKDLESKNVCNINLVTPTHFIKQIIEALEIYKPKIPIVYNTSGYESKEAILALNGYVDIFLFDFKYVNTNNAKEYSHAENYPKICKIALLTAKKWLKNDIIVDGIMQKGIIMRHLLLPNASDDGIGILDFIANNLGKDTYVSLLNQYTPYYKALTHPVLKNRPKKLEYKRLIAHANLLGMQNVFIQDDASADELYIPDFTKIG